MATPATATATITEMLQRYGLNYSAKTVREWVGLLTDDPDNFSIVEEQIKNSTQFKKRFPGLEQRVANGYNQISVDEYLALEDGYKSTMRAAGLPTSFYDEPSDFAEFVANDVARAELDQRVVQGFVAAQQAPQEVKDALREFYNLPDADAALAAYYLDPDKALPAIQKEFESAQVAGAARSTKWGDLGKEEAERLQGLGITGQAATAGFSELAQQKEVMSSNLGAGTTFTEDEQIAARFEGDADILERMRRQRQSRTAQFSGGSGAALTQRGIAGLQNT